MPQLQELLTEELRDIYDAEKQAVKAYPRLAKSISSPELKEALTLHLEETKGQVARLEQAFEILGQKAKSKPCRAMKGLIEEAMEHMSEHSKGHELDSVLIGAAQKMEHYEIAAYGTARAMAKSTKNKEVADLLNQTLQEEGNTDKKLTQIALAIQKEMLREEGESTEGVEENAGTGRSARGSASKKKSSNGRAARG